MVRVRVILKIYFLIRWSSDNQRQLIKQSSGDQRRRIRRSEPNDSHQVARECLSGDRLVIKDRPSSGQSLMMVFGWSETAHQMKRQNSSGRHLVVKMGHQVVRVSFKFNRNYGHLMSFFGKTSAAMVFYSTYQTRSEVCLLRAICPQFLYSLGYCFYFSAILFTLVNIVLSILYLAQINFHGMQSCNCDVHSQIELKIIQQQRIVNIFLNKAFIISKQSIHYL